MLRFRDRESYEGNKTTEYDDIAMKYLTYVLFLLAAGFAAYSLMYERHKSCETTICERDEVHTLVQSGTTGRRNNGFGFGIANLLKPTLGRGIPLLPPFADITEQNIDISRGVYFALASYRIFDETEKSGNPCANWENALALDIR
ncbi:hypothetical protein TSUD_398640 [Trifolium subterraneum]|uniref:Uncharacterized protein n=1 Tax=Trifolium subterraneum TaxID=3900 RepID=A0A2Z6PD77_TRISU|nr:hypothetical protein TSUD_398640 [Trifolium subterraneum]